MPSVKRPSSKPSTRKAAAQASPRAAKGQLHPRNRHQDRYDFAALLHSSPELGEFVILNPYGKQSIDFANPDAVKVFNRALLKQLYGIAHWDIPPGYLCPPIPGRADYVHGLADLLASDNQGQIPRGKNLRALDVGVGANCIYPLLGHSDYGWQFVGSDIDPTALAAAQVIIDANRLSDAITLRQQSAAQHIFHGLLASDERFDLTLCNPPFHASAAEAASGSQRKWRNLGKLDPQRKLPKLNFGGHSNELWCTGGELAFVQRMAAESREVAEQVLWFSCLVSKASNLPALEAALRKAGACDVRLQSMAQGNKQSRFLAWTYLNPSQQQAWRKAHWAVAATR